MKRRAFLRAAFATAVGAAVVGPVAVVSDVTRQRAFATAAGIVTMPDGTRVQLTDWRHQAMYSVLDLSAVQTGRS